MFNNGDTLNTFNILLVPLFRIFKVSSFTAFNQSEYEKFEDTRRVIRSHSHRRTDKAMA
jgi:hypothetical protein